MTTAYDDPRDHRLALTAKEPLAEFNRAGVLEAADVHVAVRVCDLAGEAEPRVALAVALAVRAVRGGSVCVDLTTVAADSLAPDLPWPDLDEWRAALAASPLTREPEVLRLLDDRLLYLDRYWREEEQVCDDLLARPAPVPMSEEAAQALEVALDRVFPAEGYDEQRAAARIALQQSTTVLTGGPGTGKTTTVAALLALLAEQARTQHRPLPRIALAAPTGKAAARLQQAVVEEVAKLPGSDQDALHGLQAVTLHRLLGSRPDTAARFRHHRDNRLPHDVIVVDETSMVSLTMMARLLEAVRPDTRLILVGDPDQLTSVEAGAVLADLVEGLGERSDVQVAGLRTSHRFGETIRTLAEAVRADDPDLVVELLRAGGDHVELVDDADPAPRLRELLVPHAVRLLRAAEAGEVGGALRILDEQRLLCAHREGPHGVQHWNRQVERWLGEETGQPIWSTWYAGRPLLVTANDYGLGLYNGDTGVVVRREDRSLRAAVAGSVTQHDLATSRLAQVETMHAMTIHKSQGSQADEVVIVLPPPESRLLTRELFYTALTRARDKVVVVGSEDDVRAAVARRAQRASGLQHRLRQL
ncbi:exodeoxyribonuclease V subunit alpha [Nocardioides sp. W7]|uniref:exodeoxyribonuclease V subunit alpha n=1 Tax=Nocardioides sp. W7 TaxID=2931390 RepID=UPI001FD5892B|nr:exodeoxyribonuclease V subunit alpha [Nocardioides sp. W7]